MVDVQPGRTSQAGDQRSCFVPRLDRLDFHHCILTPRGGNYCALENCYTVEILSGSTSNNGDSLVAVIVAPLDVIQIGVHPKDLPVCKVNGYSLWVDNVFRHQFLPLQAIQLRSFKL